MENREPGKYFMEKVTGSGVHFKKNNAISRLENGLEWRKMMETDREISQNCLSL